jgi:hypothetical protein
MADALTPGTTFAGSPYQAVLESWDFMGLSRVFLTVTTTWSGWIRRKGYREGQDFVALSEGKRLQENHPMTDYEIVFDPRGVVEAQHVALAPRVAALKGARLGVLDNTKWNANRLLRKTVALIEERHGIAAVN